MNRKFSGSTQIRYTYLKAPPQRGFLKYTSKTDINYKKYNNL